MKENQHQDHRNSLPAAGAGEKVAVALPAGQAADLIELDKFELYPYYKNGFLEPLPPDTEAWVKKNFPEYSVKANTADDGKLFDFPWFNAFKMMFYNKDYFKEAGITKVPTTVDEMVAASKKLTKYDSKGNVTRAGLDYRIMGGGAGTMQKYWTQAMIPYGAKVLDKVGDKWRAGYNNEAGKNALTMYINAVHKDKVVAFDHKHDAEGSGDLRHVPARGLGGRLPLQGGAQAELRRVPHAQGLRRLGHGRQHHGVGGAEVQQGEEGSLRVRLMDDGRRAGHVQLRYLRLAAVPDQH
jgi:hypothetical protein